MLPKDGRTDGRKDGRKEGRTDGSVTISLRYFVGEGIIKEQWKELLSCVFIKELIYQVLIITQTGIEYK